MAGRRRIVGGRKGPSEPHNTDANTPAQQDESDILAEVGAEPDENGDLVVDAEAIKEIGAVDAASVVENRRIQEAVNKKRGNVPGVSFNTGDLLTKYDATIKTWPPNTIDINVRRLTGAPVQHVIVTRPRSGTELYQELKKFHGQYEEAEYEVKLVDNSSKEFRGSGRIVMPDTRAAPQQGQPMQPVYAGYPPPHPGYPQQPQPTPPTPPPAQPVQIVAPPAPPAAPAPDPIATMQSMFHLFQQMQQMAQPPQPPPPPPPVQFVPPPQPQFVMPPPPPPQANPEEMLDYTKRLFEMFQQMQQQPAHAPQAPQQAPQAPPPPVPPPPNPMTAIAPPFPPPPGMFWAPPYGYLPIPGAQQQQQPQSEPRGPMFRPGPHRPQPPPSYYEQTQPGYRPQPDPRYAPQQPPSAPPSAADQFRQSIGVLRTAMNSMHEMNEMMSGFQGGGGHHEVAETPAIEDDGSPVRVVETGPARVVYNKEDGSVRGFETLVANADKIFKFVGEQTDRMRDAQERRQQKQQPQRTLPAGYVEVGPGYQPPAGYVAVPVDELPPAPEYVPPPVSRTWGPASGSE